MRPASTSVGHDRLATTGGIRPIPGAFQTQDSPDDIPMRRPVGCQPTDPRKPSTSRTSTYGATTSGTTTVNATSITYRSIESAVLGIFRSCGMGHSGGRLLFGHLERRWRTTGFRRGDLYDALDRLESAHCLSFEQADKNGVDVVLLPNGYRRLTLVPLTPGGWLREIFGALRMLSAGRRHNPEIDSTHKRRQDDQTGENTRRGKAARIAIEGRMPTGTS